MKKYELLKEHDRIRDTSYDLIVINYIVRFTNKFKEEYKLVWPEEERNKFLLAFYEIQGILEKEDEEKEN